MGLAADGEPRGTQREFHAGSSAVAWTLLMLGVACFAPCVLIPEWRAYQAADMAEQWEEHRLDSLQKLVERDRRRLAAIRTDPGVIVRMALRELSFHNPRQRHIRVAVSAPDTLAANITGRWNDGSPFVVQAAELPTPIARIASWLPALDYDRVFCDNGARLVIMAMSVALMGVALWMPPLKRRLS